MVENHIVLKGTEAQRPAQRFSAAREKPGVDRFPTENGSTLNVNSSTNNMVENHIVLKGTEAQRPAQRFSAAREKPGVDRFPTDSEA